MKTFIIFLSFVLGLTSISTTASPLADCYATKAGASTKNYTYSYSGGATADSNIYEILKESERAYGGILNGAEIAREVGGEIPSKHSPQNADVSKILEAELLQKCIINSDRIEMSELESKIRDVKKEKGYLYYPFRAVLDSYTQADYYAIRDYLTPLFLNSEEFKLNNFAVYLMITKFESEKEIRKRHFQEGGLAITDKSDIGSVVRFLKKQYKYKGYIARSFEALSLALFDTDDLRQLKQSVIDGRVTTTHLNSLELSVSELMPDYALLSFPTPKLTKKQAQSLAKKFKDLCKSEEECFDDYMHRRAHK